MNTELDLSDIHDAPLIVTFSGGRALIGEPEDEHVRWRCVLSAMEMEDDEDSAARPEILVATAEIVVARPREYRLLDVLDSDAELAEFATLAVDWTADLLIVSRLLVPPHLRGHGFGFRLASLALAELGGGCSMAALVAAPFELAFDDPTYGAEQARLQRAWALFGFEFGSDGIGLMDLTDDR